MSARSFSFSIFFSLLGSGGGVALILFGLANEPALPLSLLHWRGLAVVLGGLLAVLCLAFSLAEVSQSLALLWEVLSGGDPDREGVLKECVMLATRGREAEGQETKFYREVKPYLSHRMLQSGIELLIAGYSPEMIRNTLNTLREQDTLRYQTALQLLRSLMQAAWLLGIAGAAAGLPQTDLLFHRAQMTIYFSALAVPLVTGLLLAAVVFLPLIRQLELHQRDWNTYLEMSICGVTLLQARHHALYLETVLKAYLPPAPVLPPAAVQAPAQAAVPPGSTPVRASFQDALRQEAPAAAADEEEPQALSVDELRRFRPIQQRPPQRPGDKPKGP